VALRVIADHSRAAAFLVADGVMPSNEGRGYVLRRVMRRAIRFGVKAGIDRPFLHKTAASVIDRFSGAYPELRERQVFVGEVIQAEEERFRRTLERGMRLIETEIQRVGKGGTIPGDVAFTLSDTYGFPPDLTELIASEQGVAVDMPGFDTSLQVQRSRGRAAWKGSGEKAVGELWHRLATELGPTQFTGYERTLDASTVLALVRREGDESEQVERLEPGQQGVVLLEKTPFYGESGGQVGDTGWLGDTVVTDTTTASGLNLHHVAVGATPLTLGAVVEAKVDAERRGHTRRNHTATHLLHKALRTVLGEHVTQKGSLVSPDRLRFDFSHHRAMTADEIRRVEHMVNAEILHNHGVETQVKALDEAISGGAMALFGEKYGDRVRVVSVPGFSVELCGGTHVGRTGDIGLFRITAESGVAAGIRRIEAQTGMGALRAVESESDLLGLIAERLRTNPANAVDAISRLQDERRDLERQLSAATNKLASAAAGDLLSRARVANGVKVLAAEYDGDLKEQADRLRDQLGTSLVVLGSRAGGKVMILAAATKDIAGTRVHAGKVIERIAPLVGGRGGGRPDLAQAGGKDPEGLTAALQQVYDMAEEIIGRTG
jgi:alanyl-tRNA synthetase